MREVMKRHAVLGCWLLFLPLFAARAAEVVLLRLDETALGENCLHKLLGILLLRLVLRALGWRRADIGFGGSLRGAGAGLLLGAGTFAAAFAAELLLLRGMGRPARLDFFTTGFSLTGEAAAQTGPGAVLLCVVLNIVNVVMEEGTFRGLFPALLRPGRGERTALLLPALLFGVWHIAAPLRGLADGAMGPGAFLALSAGYVLLSGLMGVKWSLLYRLTGSLRAGMADHFFNNCIATNLLHVVTDRGTDELLVFRIALSQLLSFALVLAVYQKNSAREGAVRLSKKSF